MIVLNGGSSSGKSTLSRCLQEVLPGHWLSLSVDTFVDALPANLQGAEAGIAVGPHGEVSVGPEFRRLDRAWAEGVAAMVRAGARVVLDEVFLGGPASQHRWLTALDGIEVLWVGVRCEASVAAAREAARGDREPGMAAGQADLVHEGVRYDIEVDSARNGAMECARLIAQRAK
ncbi:chloramphenicol phosphotransferase CPT [Streptomyces sp. NPDC051561]|uniref:chloramphenicol phosphotransferase CPT n=1 Tax=Streptomyces sp. NPDC051561 TaxID=3365658 RepID=UPI0037A9EBDA